jgi:hypothetical protein
MLRDFISQDEKLASYDKTRNIQKKSQNHALNDISWMDLFLFNS